MSVFSRFAAKPDMRVLLRLSVQRALLGNITANVAGVRSEIAGSEVTICAFFFNEPSQSDQEHIEDAAGEIIADFASPYVISTRYGLVSDVRIHDFGWDFLRAEAMPQNA